MVVARGESASHEPFGPYRLIREIAAGGMATVYEAVRLEDGAHVAIKRIHPHLAKDRDFVEMFLDEARLAARIEHPHVCRVLGSGSVEGASYLAMELLEGKTLQQILAAFAKRPEALEPGQPLRFVLGVIADCADGLHAAHELRGADGRLLDVVHRDVSPQNLFVTFDGRVKVVDFGVASARDKNHRTETGEIKGKLAYMAPEQTIGRVDRRADVWALGVVLWEAITLKRLFRRATQPETLVAVEREPIPAPSSLHPDVPPALDALVLAALERDPAARVPDAATFAARLRAILSTVGGAPSLKERAEILATLFGTSARQITTPERTDESTRGPDSPPRTGVSQLLAPERADASTRAAGSPAARPRWPFAVAAVAVALALGLGQFLLATPGPIADARPPIVEAAVEATVVAPTAVEAPVAEVVASTPAAIPAIVSTSPPAAPARSPRPRLAPSPAETAPSAPTEAAPPAPTEAVPPASPAPTGVGRVTVPMGVAVCFDAPCDRAHARLGPRTVVLPSGHHEVVYIEMEGPEAGPAVVLGTGAIEVAPDTTTVVPRR